MGTFYRQAPDGYVVVTAPVGAIITTLPSGYSSVVRNGVTYYVYGGVYYLPHERGFVVVAEPAGSPEPAPTVPVATVLPSQVRISAASLNVRSKPEATAPATHQLMQGTLVPVIGNAPGWYQIKLTNGTIGWIMIKYTTPVLPAKG